MPLTDQTTAFAAAIAAGMVLALLFDLYRVLRMNCRPVRIVTPVTDLLYWLTAIGVAFSFLLFSNWGEVRFYLFIGFFVGGTVYQRLIGRHVRRVLHKLVKLWIWIIQKVKFIIGVVIWPVCWLAGRTCRCIAAVRTRIHVNHPPEEQ